LPENLITEVEKCKTNLAVRKVGVAFAIEQSKELLAAGVPVLHYYFMGKSDNVHAIAAALF
jgi:methylenetetrahydrofolate reductase (NADPH)